MSSWPDGDVACNIDLEAVFQPTSGKRRGHHRRLHHVSSPAHPKLSTYFKIGDDRPHRRRAGRPQHRPTGYESLKVYILSTQKLLRADGLLRLPQSLLLHHRRVHPAMRDKLNISPYFYDGYVARLTTGGVLLRTAAWICCDSEVRAADIFNPKHPIRTKDRSDPSTYCATDSHTVHSLVADGCIIEGTVEDCVIFRGVKVGKNAVVRNCVLMQDTVIEEGANIRHVITDKDVTIKAHRSLAGHGSYPLCIDKGSII